MASRFTLPKPPWPTEPTMPLKPLLQKAIDQLTAKMDGKPALAVTCFASDLEGAKELLHMVESAFPGAAVNLVQPRRLAWQTEASCEGAYRAVRQALPVPRVLRCPARR